jgi:TATA-binding protein-associated factor
VGTNRYLDKNLLLTLYFSLPLSTLAPTLFPFFRHTIPNVRLAVVKTLHSFMSVSSLPRDWIAAPFLRLLFQNLVVEERSDIRDASLCAWRTALITMSAEAGWLEDVCTGTLIYDWYDITMTPLGVPINLTKIYHPTVNGEVAPERHNVDKNMLAQDLSLVSIEITLKARVAAATALACLMVSWQSMVCIICACMTPICSKDISRTRPWKKCFNPYLHTTLHQLACFRNSLQLSLLKNGLASTTAGLCLLRLHLSRNHT